MARNTISLSEYDDNIDKLSNLKEGDSLFTFEFGYSPDSEDNGCKVTEFIFKKYEEASKSHIEGIDDNFEGIKALIVDKRFPNVEISQDISSSFYLSESNAAYSFLETMTYVVTQVEEYIKENKLL